MTTIYKGDDVCELCDGWKEVDHEGVSRKHWEEMPAASRVALTMGWVDFEPCPECHGTGRQPNADVLPAG